MITCAALRAYLRDKAAADPAPAPAPTPDPAPPPARWTAAVIRFERVSFFANAFAVSMTAITVDNREIGVQLPVTAPALGRLLTAALGRAPDGNFIELLREADGAWVEALTDGTALLDVRPLRD